MRIRFGKMIFAVAVLALMTSCGTKDDETTEVSDMFGQGWNLGNTLDAKSDGDMANKGLSTEKSWGMPKTTEAMIKAVASEGFKTIRIPVSWHNHLTDSNYTIDSAWMARVKQIVDWSLSCGLKVIINIHHDNLSEAQMSSTYGFCVPENNSDLKDKSLLYICAIWEQVSEAFKSYNENLVFELLNEPRAVGKTYEWNGSGSTIQKANKIIMEYEKAALDVIRSSGGNNASRYVMVPPYAASPSMTEGWSLPKDSASGKLIVSVHAYTPYEFCMSTASVNSFTDSHKGSIDWLFTSLKSDYLSKEIPVIIGEASASDKNNAAERKKWADYYYKKAKSLGIPVVLWDNMVTASTGDINSGECHGWFNRNDLSWYFPEIMKVMLK
ncbi:glycoside hydrolase family 5 protein [uncultured Treponema sp.]|uniref:glycoside hydrolase family 5 protein n=1 Tax=uncultured Treponema sp. TaxID=162155 RepID=UPI0025F39D8C|nr:glycoside hydrolase family 5 protein [uncultured Treponema sp.]